MLFVVFRGNVEFFRSDSAFKQQRLPAWQPILTPKPVISFFIIAGLIFIPLGVLFYLTSEGVCGASIFEFV